MHREARIAVAPSSGPEWVADAVRDGGGYVVEGRDATGLVWTDARDAESLAEFLGTWPQIDWVQVPFAGVENFIPFIDEARLWTCGKGVYSEPVAEHALALMLAGMRNIAGYARMSSWSGPVGRNLLGSRVAILGGGGITESLVRLLGPFGCHITVVRKNVCDMVGVHTVVSPDHLADALVGADVVVLALALTPQTTAMIGRDEFSLMENHAWLINVARGAHVVTQDLVWALETGQIGGAALDVTDPEPLPADHRLWSLDNCIITPHVGNTPEMAVPLLAERIRSNVRRYRVGEELLGRIDIRRGY
jgi:phosphoglycerate dehydrogenase-like enzyme